MDYEQLKIKSYKHWDVVLHENQCYLGRVFIALKDGRGIEDFLAITGDVRDEFFLIGASVKSALKTLFNPDKMNYAALSNTSEKIHVHLVPRYKTPRTFASHTFTDSRWGKNYAPYDPFPLPDTTLLEIISTLRSHL
jgi:diadenosine tetraphosphate (Ap4A) HIT family hydrolase